MGNFKVGDVVTRKSYNKDIIFKIIDIVDSPGEGKRMILKGVELRLIADSPESDLVRVSMDDIRNFNETFNKKINNIVKNIVYERTNVEKSNLTRGISEDLRGSTHFGRVGKVLHIDGDGEYLDICLKIYDQLEIEAVGKNIPEKEQPKVLESLIREYSPDILILTGHDSINKDYKDFSDIDGYKNSKYFVEAVKKARSIEPNLDELVIFAGACQSHFEALISAGANFASSPHRTLIHCLDPVFISEKIAYTAVDRFLSIEEVLENTISGIKGIGGLQTRGKYRKGLPKSPYQ